MTRPGLHYRVSLYVNGYRYPMYKNYTTEEFNLIKEMIAKPQIAVLYTKNPKLHRIAKMVLQNKCVLLKYDPKW